MDINREELIWAAGLFEGEGCFCWVKIPNRNNRNKKDYSYCQASLHTTDKDVLERFVKAVGIGVVNGPYIYTDTKVPNRKPSWYWSIRGHERVQAVIAILWPWLGNRRKNQARSCLTKTISGGNSPGTGWDLRKASCPQGHMYDISNTYIDKKGSRVCRKCRNLSATKWYFANKERAKINKRRSYLKLKNNVTTIYDSPEQVGNGDVQNVERVDILDNIDPNVVGGER